MYYHRRYLWHIYFLFGKWEYYPVYLGHCFDSQDTCVIEEICYLKLSKVSKKELYNISSIIFRINWEAQQEKGRDSVDITEGCARQGSRGKGIV